MSLIGSRQLSVAGRRVGLSCSPCEVRTHLGLESSWKPGSGAGLPSPTMDCGWV